MNPYHETEHGVLYNSECVALIKQLPDNSVDSIVTDPPYELVFMGKHWDNTGIAYSVELWTECLRVLKPGGHLLSFGGSRTYHRMACAIEDAGFFVKDMIEYMYGSGFPKSLNIEKALQKELDKEPNNGIMAQYEKDSKALSKYCLRLMPEANLSQEVNTNQKQGEVLQSELSEQSLQIPKHTPCNVWCGQSCLEGRINIEANSRELSRCKVCQMSERISCNGTERWLCYATPFGYGSESWSDIAEGRDCPSYRPQSEQQSIGKSDVIRNEQRTQDLRRAIETYKGFGNNLKPAHEPICLAMKPISEKNIISNVLKYGTGGINIDGCRVEFGKETDNRIGTNFVSNGGDASNNANDNQVPNQHYVQMYKSEGRFPANLIHDGSDEVLECFPNAGKGNNGNPYNYSGNEYHNKDNSMFNGDKPISNSNFNDSGSASRFFYCAKASKAERNAGCEGLEKKQPEHDFGTKLGVARSERIHTQTNNNHPTVKPLALMRYLCRLITPPNGTVLDPFSGSGSTLLAAKQEGFRFIGIEMQEEYCNIIKHRLDAIPEIEYDDQTELSL